MLKSDETSKEQIMPMQRHERAAKHWRRLALLVVAMGVFLAIYWPVQAAMELMYYNAESTNSAVLLSWGTAREIDVEGYIILCKLDSEPESAYHFIGQRAAIGGPDQPAEYSFAVTEDVSFGEQYCFRLEEVTTNDEPGEKRDICGYGPGVTPTPATGGIPLSVTGTIVPIIVTPVPGLSPAPTLIAPSPTASWTPVGQSPIVTPAQFVSPLGTPLPTSTVFADGASLPGTPTWTPWPTESQTVTGTVTATVTTTPTPTATATQPGSPLAAAIDSPNATADGDDDMLAFTPAAQEPTVPADQVPTLQATQAAAPPAMGSGPFEATPTQMYIVVTATPTPEALAVAPTMTALPTVTSTPDMGLLSVFTPSAQSMMVMMLCLIFLSATGLGTLGLVTTILYFRSQTQRRTDGNDYISRRRY